MRDRLAALFWAMIVCVPLTACTVILGHDLQAHLGVTPFVGGAITRHGFSHHVGAGLQLVIRHAG